MQTQDPPYKDKVYKALKEKVQGFKLTPEEFAQKLSDQAYQKKVYGALKEKVQGFAVAETDFFQRLNLKSQISNQKSEIAFDPKADLIQPQDATSMAPPSELKAATRSDMLRRNEITEQFDETGALQSVGSFNKAIVSGAAAIPKSVAILAKQLDDFTGAPEKPIEEYATYQMGDWMEKKAAEVGITATDPTRNGFFDTQVPQALGSVASIMLTGGRGLLQNTGKELLVNAPKGVLGTTASALTNPATVSGGLQMAVPEYEAAKAAGLDEDQAFEVFLKNYGVGQTEALPLARAFNRIGKITGGNVIEILKAGGQGGLEEATQELVQTYMSNQIAQGSYDPSRDPLMGMIEAGQTGFFVGFILPGIGAALKDSPADTRTNVTNFLNEKLKQRSTESELKVNEQQDQSTPIEKSTPSPLERAGVRSPKPENLTNLPPNEQTNETGEIETDPISPGGEQEGSRSQQEDAENITRTVQEASPKTQGAQRSERQLKKDQDQELEAYARKSGSFIEDVKESFGEKLDGGTEQDVYLNKEGDKVIKVNGLANNSGWAEFWDRLNLQKQLFPNTSYKLIGFTKSGGRLSAVSEQPFIEGAEVPRQELLEDLANRGFYQIHPEGSPGQNQFYNPDLGIRLSDVHGENVIKDADGNIRYIDPMLDRENPFVDEESQQYFNAQKAKYQSPQEETTTQNPEALPGETINQPTDEEGNQGRQEESLLAPESGAAQQPAPSSNDQSARTQKISQRLKSEGKSPEAIKIVTDQAAKLFAGDGTDLILKMDDVGVFASSGDMYGVRLDLDMPTKDIRKAVADIRKGNPNTAPAKRLIEKIMAQKDNPEFRFNAGSGAFLERQGIALEDFLMAELEISGEIDNLTPLDAEAWWESLSETQRNEYEQGKIQEQSDLRGETQADETQQDQPASADQQLAADISGKVRSLRSAQGEERLKIAQEIVDLTGRYLLNREGIITGTDASFADRTSSTFFDLIDEGKSVYLLSPNSKIAETPEDFQQIAEKLGTELPLQEGKLMFDDAFNNNVINAARELGFDGVRLLEIDGTNSTIQVTNFDKLTHVTGEDFIKSKSPTTTNEPTSTVPPPPPTEQNPISPEEGQGEAVRKIAARYLSDPEVDEEAKAGLSEEGKNYIPTTDLKRQATADAYIEVKGVDQAIADITDPDNGMSDQNRVFIGKTIYKRLKAEKKNSDNPDEIRAKINQVIELMAPLGTRYAQTLQAFANMFASDVDQVAYTLKKEYEGKRQKAFEYAEPEVKSIKDIIDLAPDEALKTLLNDPRIKSLLEESRKAENTRQGKRKQFTKRVLDKLDELEKQIDNNLKSGRLNADITFGLLPLAYKAAINVIRAAVKAGDSLADAVEKAVKSVDAKNWDEAGFRKQFETEIKQEEKRDRKTLLEVLDQSNTSFRELALKHYKTYNKSKQDIATLLQNEFGLEQAESERLGKTLDKIVGEKRKQMIEQRYQAKTPGQKRVSKQMAEKIQEFTNLGVMSDQNLREAYLSAIGLPSLTGKQAAEMERLVEVAEGRPEGFQRYEAIQDLIKYHQKVTPLNFLEVAESIWYANMLSGLSTQSLNFQANSVATLAELYTTSIQSIVEYKNHKTAFKNLAFILRGMSDGYKRNLTESAHILKTGYTPIKGQKFDESAFRGVKTSKASVLETLENTNPLSWWKYVGRLMAATDILFYGGLRGMRAHQLAFREALNENKNTYSPEVLKRANEILGRDSVKEAEAQALSEGLEGNQADRRIAEIIEQKQKPELREDANSFAAKGTYNYEPEGVLGIMTGIINNATTKLPGLKTIVPFSRVIANVLNDYLNYTPWGLVRVAKGGMGIPTKNSFRRFTHEEMLREKIKAITGTSALVALYAMTKSDDDEEPWLQITSNGAGDMKKNYELGETGWTPYSFKIRGFDKWISYQNTPLAIPFALIGHLRDAEKYQGVEVDTEKLGIVASGLIHYITDMSFLSGMADFFEMFSRTNANTTAEKVGMFVNRTVKTLVVPNLVTQVSRGIQEVIEAPMKKGDGIFGQYYRDIPVLRDNLNTMYNALGEHIITETLYKFNPILTRFTDTSDEQAKESYKIWQLIVDNQAWIGAPSKNVKIFDRSERIERLLTEEEYYRYSVQAGKYTKELLLKSYESLAKEKDQENVQKRIRDLKEKARERALSELQR